MLNRFLESTNDISCKKTSSAEKTIGGPDRSIIHTHDKDDKIELSANIDNQDDKVELNRLSGAKNNNNNIDGLG